MDVTELCRQCGSWQYLYCKGTSQSHSEIQRFTNHFVNSVNTQRLGYGKPLKLVTTCIKPRSHDAYPASFSLSRRCQQHIANTDKLAQGICREWRRKEAIREASTLISCGSFPACSRGCVTEARNGRVVIIAPLTACPPSRKLLYTASAEQRPGVLTCALKPGAPIWFNLFHPT